jgi:hypothetical protein
MDLDLLTAKYASFIEEVLVASRRHVQDIVGIIYTETDAYIEIRAMLDVDGKDEYVEQHMYYSKAVDGSAFMEYGPKKVKDLDYYKAKHGITREEVLKTRLIQYGHDDESAEWTIKMVGEDD